MLVLSVLLFTTKLHGFEWNVHLIETVKHLVGLLFGIYQTLILGAVNVVVGFVIYLAISGFQSQWIDCDYTDYCEYFKHTITYGQLLLPGVARTPKSMVITPLISFWTYQLLGQQILMLFCLHLKTGRYLVPTGQTPHLFTHWSILVHPRKGLHKPPSNNWWRWSVLPRRP